MFIDTHTHISYNSGINPKEYVSNAINANVKYLIVSCCDKKSIEEGLKLINEFDNIYLTIGYHPSEVKNVTDKDFAYLEELLVKYDKIIAIGEIGLDYYYEKDLMLDQKELFIKQLDLAKKYNLPVVIHTRDAIQETYDILKKYSLIGDIHCFSGSLEMAKLFINLGYKLGIGGVITFKNNKLIDVVKELGLNDIILETDSPYLSPDRGKINESKNIILIAKKISEVLDVDLSEVMNRTTFNAVSLFDLDIKI